MKILVFGAGVLGCNLALEFLLAREGREAAGTGSWAESRKTACGSKTNSHPGCAALCLCRPLRNYGAVSPAKNIKLPLRNPQRE